MRKGSHHQEGSKEETDIFHSIESGIFIMRQGTTSTKRRNNEIIVEASESKRPNKWVMLIILALGAFMSTLDSSIINIGLPKIARFFGVPLNGAIEWIIIAYLVVIAGTLLTIGRLADMVGRKTLWTAGVVIFTVGSALCGAAPSLLVLIIARVFQGLGGALIFAVVPTMLTGAFPPNERGKVLGLNSVFVALGTSVGPTIGGLITANFSWRWIFYVNVPLGIAVVIATLVVMKGREPRTTGRFDPAGALLLSVGLIALTLAFSFGQEWGWTSPRVMTLLAVCVLALTLLSIVEMRVTDPVLDLKLLRNRVFFSANFSLILSNLALFTVSFIMPFYLEELRSLPADQAGLLLTPFPLTIVVIAPFSGSLADRIGSRWLAATGLTMACIGLFLLSQLNAQSSLWDVIWRLIFTGAGQAIFQSPNNSALMGAAPRHQQGVAGGFLATSRVMGQSISVALSGAIFASLGGALAGATMIHMPRSFPTQAYFSLQNTFITAFHTTLIVCACIAAIGVATSLVRGKEGRGKHGAAGGIGE
jgi:EmrB/QacA subfamily drug resistance transporter